MHKEFQIGDYIEGCEDGLHITGTVAVIEGKYLGVECDSDMHDSSGRLHGHNLKGILTNRTGWWISKNNAMLVSGFSDVSDDSVEDLFNLEV